MAVYIKGLFKPKACVDCWFWQHCDLWRNRNWGSEAPENCPIESSSVKCGRWTFDRYKSFICQFICSSCEKTAPVAYNFCPHCGAKMR